MAHVPESDAPVSGAGRPRPATYRIRVAGALPARFADRFGALAIAPQPNGDTLLTGPVADQAELHALLRKVRDLGVPLVSVVRLESSDRS